MDLLCSVKGMSRLCVRVDVMKLVRLVSSFSYQPSQNVESWSEVSSRHASSLRSTNALSVNETEASSSL